MKRANENQGSRSHEEGSTVRPRERPSAPELRAQPQAGRVEQKLLEARELITLTDEADPRRRLLEAATLRGDEGLVDAILSTLRRPQTAS